MQWKEWHRLVRLTIHIINTTKVLILLMLHSFILDLHVRLYFGEILVRCWVHCNTLSERLDWWIPSLSKLQLQTRRSRLLRAIRLATRWCGSVVEFDAKLCRNASILPLGLLELDHFLTAKALRTICLRFKTCLKLLVVLTLLRLT